MYKKLFAWLQELPVAIRILILALFIALSVLWWSYRGSRGDSFAGCESKVKELTRIYEERLKLSRDAYWKKDSLVNVLQRDRIDRELQINEENKRRLARQDSIFYYLNSKR